MEEFVELCGSDSELRRSAAEILTESFTALGVPAWPDIESAIKEVKDCCSNSRMVIGLVIDGRLAGWGGLQSMYGDVTWELHPLVVDREMRGRRVGAKLLCELERRARRAGVANIALGTDDEYHGTSLSDFDPTVDDLGQAIKSISNRANHPFEFYQKQGYRIVGIIPHANGRGKPDIIMWKAL